MLIMMNMVEGGFDADYCRNASLSVGGYIQRLLSVKFNSLLSGLMG